MWRILKKMPLPTFWFQSYSFLLFMTQLMTDTWLTATVLLLAFNTMNKLYNILLFCLLPKSFIDKYLPLEYQRSKKTNSNSISVNNSSTWMNASFLFSCGQTFATIFNFHAHSLNSIWYLQKLIFCSPEGIISPFTFLQKCCFSNHL